MMTLTAGAESKLIQEINQLYSVDIIINYVALRSPNAGSTVPSYTPHVDDRDSFIVV
jgi:hypothetical protein